MSNAAYTNGEQKKKPSLALAIVLLIFFWPVGIYLLYRYFTYDKTEVFNNSKIIRNFGIVFAVFAVLGIATSGFDIGTIMLCFFFLIGGGFMLFRSIEMKKAADRYKVYIDLIVNNGNDNIDTIANRASQSAGVVEADLNKMIKLGIFQNAEIDTMRRTIDIHIDKGAQAGQPEASSSSDSVSVKCPNCGAIAGIPQGRSAECEYCATVLQAN